MYATSMKYFTVELVNVVFRIPSSFGLARHMPTQFFWWLFCYKNVEKGNEQKAFWIIIIYAVLKVVILWRLTTIVGVV
jgi:hypothetical protein